jgi:molybdenum cofactor cytidylyltransferase
MGTNKLLLPMTGRTVIECVVMALIDGGVQHVIVVTPVDVTAVARAAEAAGAKVCLLPEQTSEMRETVEHGLRWLEDRYHPRVDDAWLLAPADFPAVDSMVIRELCGRYPNDQGKTIIAPVFGRKRGHPILLAWHHVSAIRNHPPHLGLDTYLRLNAEQVLEVPTEKEGILADIDTPEDYGTLQEYRKPGAES